MQIYYISNRSINLIIQYITKLVWIIEAQIDNKYIGMTIKFTLTN